jgi:hypothetical protein
MPDTIVCTILFPAEFQGGKNPTWTVRYKVEGSTDPEAVKAALADQSDLTYGGLVRDTYTAKEEGNGLWLGEVRYVSAEMQRREPQPVGSVRETFNSGGGTQHITQSRETIACYPGEDFPVLMDNTRGAIGVTLEGEVQGCDVVTPAYNFTRRKVFLPGEVTNEYKGVIFALTGKTNDDEFEGFAEGEVLFLGAEGSDRDDGCYEINFNFSAKPNRTGVTIGGIEGIDYGGWDYVWILYVPKENEDTKLVMKVPGGVWVERVYDSGDFSDLGDLSVTEPT